jgi:hypothetical protein
MATTSQVLSAFMAEEKDLASAFFDPRLGPSPGIRRRWPHVPQSIHQFHNLNHNHGSLPLPRPPTRDPQLSIHLHYRRERRPLWRVLLKSLVHQHDTSVSAAPRRTAPHSTGRASPSTSSFNAWMPSEPLSSRPIQPEPRSRGSWSTSRNPTCQHHRPGAGTSYLCC